MDDEAAARAGYGAGAVAAAKRILMLLPAMEQEFGAEERHRLAGEGAFRDGLTLDAAWGERFGRALAASLAAAAPPPQQAQ